MQWSSPVLPVYFDPQELPCTTHLLFARQLEWGKKFQELCHLEDDGRHTLQRVDIDLPHLQRFSIFWCCTDFRARFLELPSSPWWFFVWHSLYSTNSSLTVKYSIWQSYCFLNALIPKWITLFHQTRRRSERGFYKPIVLEDHICSIWWSSNGLLAFDLFPRPLFFKSFFFTHSTTTTSSKFSLSKLSGAGGHGRCRKYLRRPLRYVCSEPSSYSLPLFSFPVCRISTTTKNALEVADFCCRNVVKVQLCFVLF